MTTDLHADLRLYIKTGDSAPARNLCTQALDALERKDALLREALYALDYATDMTKPEGLSGCKCPICTCAAAITKELTPDNAEVSGPSTRPPG